MSDNDSHKRPPTIDRPVPPVIDQEMPFEAEGRDIFFAAVETTRMPMLVTDPNQPDNPIVFCNPAFSQMTGYSQNEIVGRNCRFLQGPETEREKVAEIRAAVEAKRETSLEILNYRKDGTSFWNALYISPVLGKKGELLYFFASQLDISRRRDAEDALRQAQKMEAVGQLTGGIAHDFNNLLQVIIGYVDVIAARVKGGEDQRLGRAVDAIGAAAQRGATLTAQLLAFARKQDLQGRLINLNTLIAGFDALIERTVGEHGITVKHDLATDLANCRADPVQVEMALLNILINARDAIGEGGGTITITTRNRRVDAAGPKGAPRPGDYVELAVKDTGSGIPADVIGQVFEPFFTTKDVGKGTGLGLSMVYGFMKQSGGGVAIDSRPGEGTTLSLLFPQDGGAVQRTESVRADQRRGDETILIVEDQPDVALLAETILADYGYNAIVAHNAREALDVIERGDEFDLLFSDIIMPGGMNGVMLAQEVRRRRAGAKILLTTGYADRNLDDGNGMTSEFDVLHKPYRRTDLAARVRQVLDGPTGVG